MMKKTDLYNCFLMLFVVCFFMGSLTTVYAQSTEVDLGEVADDEPVDSFSSGQDNGDGSSDGVDLVEDDAVILDDVGGDDVVADGDGAAQGQAEDDSSELTDDESEETGDGSVDYSDDVSSDDVLDEMSGDDFSGDSPVGSDDDGGDLDIVDDVAVNDEDVMPGDERVDGVIVDSVDIDDINESDAFVQSPSEDIEDVVEAMVVIDDELKMPEAGILAASRGDVKAEMVSPILSEVNEERTIILRSDNFAAWWSVDSAIYVTDYVRNMGVPQTLAVIPIVNDAKYELGSDSRLTDYLISISDDPDVELGLQGLYYTYNEFQELSVTDAEKKLADAKAILKTTIFVDPVTFIPPYFAYDENALTAAKNQDFQYFSAGWNAINNGHGFVEHPSGLMNIPATTDVYNWGEGRLNTVQEITSSCEYAMDDFGTCNLLLLHHTFQDANGNIDPEKIAVLGELMEWVKTKESEGVKLKTIGRHESVSSPEPKKKFIVFRSDDIAPFWSVSSAISITETLRNRGVPQVLSVVPTNVGYLLDDDPTIADYLNVIKDDALIEIALHGYDHSEYEFRDISYDDAVFKVGTGLEILQDVLDIAPTAFVPPYHEYNDNTLRALKMHNIGTISSGYEDFVDGVAFREDEHEILHLPIGAEFYNWWENRVNTAEEIIGPCEIAMDNYNVCIIMLHHHMFGDGNGNMDPRKVKVLTDVADWAKEKEAEGTAKIALLKDIGIDDL